MAGKNLKKMTKNEDAMFEQKEDNLPELSDTVFNENGESEEFDLEAGYIDENGICHNTYTLREIIGKDEEAVNKGDIRSNAAKVVTTLLTRCCLSIGTLTKKELGVKKWEEIIQNLPVGDQDIMFLKLREISVGNEFEVVHKCNECGTELKTYISIDELEIVPFKGNRTIDFELPRGYKDGKGNIHREGKIRLPLGKDREVLSPLLKKNVGKAKTAMLTRLCTFNSGYPVTDEVISSLTFKDRDYLQSVMDEFLFGVNTQVDITCVNCGNEFKGNLNPTNFI